MGTPLTPQPVETCWTLVVGAADGELEARARFAERYEAVIQAYLQARWRSNAWKRAIPDTVQEVFLEIFKSGGLLDKVQPGLPGGFRAFLFGAVRRVAQRVEEGRGMAREKALPTQHEDLGIGAVDPHLSQVFDRAWAQTLMRQAGRSLADQAKGRPELARHVELLQLRFGDGLPVREIAKRWNEPAERVHKSYATARVEFRRALYDVLAEHNEGSPAELDQRARELLDALG